MTTLPMATDLLPYEVQEFERLLNDVRARTGGAPLNYLVERSV